MTVQQVHETQTKYLNNIYLMKNTNWQIEMTFKVNEGQNTDCTYNYHLHTLKKYNFSNRANKLS
jgi:hypothetical protein